MLAIRLLLFGGMLLHKGVWEFMKRGQSADQTLGASGSASLFKRIIKLGKAAFLLFLLVQTLFLEIFPVSASPGILQSIGLVIYVLGLSLAIIGRLQLGKNWANLEDYQVLSDQGLVKSGIYAYIRHPIYIGDLLLVLGVELALNSWLVLGVVGLAVVVFRQALAEEQLLVDKLPGYTSYRQKTKMFIPYLL